MMGDVSYISNGSSEVELNAQTLDQLYKEQLQNLRELIFKQNQNSDIELCRKWLKVFSMTTKREKIARNCLCSLMQQQLQEFGFLDAPFTDLQNCNRDLDQVLHDLDEHSSVEESETYASHHRLDMGPPTNREPPTERSDLITELTCQENATQAENVMLRGELEALRLQLTEKQIENLKLKEIAEKCQLENTEGVDTFGDIKRSLVDSMQKSLHELMKRERHFPLNVFELVFRDFSNDAEFSLRIKKCDANFNRLLNDIFQKELNERKSMIARHVSRNFGKSTTKLRRKYERRLKVQVWAQKLQLKLVKIKCFSALRQLFITTQNGGDASMWEMLKVLEEKYQTIVDEMI